MPKYLFKYKSEHLDWLNTNIPAYVIVKEQGFPVFFGFYDSKQAMLYRLRIEK